MVVKILGNSDTTAYKEAERVVKSLGLAVWNETYFFCGCRYRSVID